MAKSLYIGEPGFNEDETNCGIAHILGILVMSSQDHPLFPATSVICILCPLNACMVKEKNIMGSYGFYELRARQLSIEL